MIWNVPEIIAKLSEGTRARRHHHDRTPSGVAATIAGDKIDARSKASASSPRPSRR